MKLERFINLVAVALISGYVGRKIQAEHDIRIVDKYCREVIEKTHEEWSKQNHCHG